MKIYLDYAATTPPSEAAIRAMEESMREAWHNPSSAYGAANAARRQLRMARRDIAALMGAEASGMVFTSGGTEGNNLAMNIARGKHAVVSSIEHASVLEAAKRMCAQVTYIPCDSGSRISPESVEAAIHPDTALISVQYANNETGVIQPVSEIGAIARKRRIPFHCDAVQAFGHVPVDVSRDKIDLMTISAHKFHGPRGAGALYVRPGISLPPLISGGSQEFGLRAGTENTAAIWAMAKAAQAAAEDMSQRAVCERELMDAFCQRLKSLLPACMPLCPDAERLPGVMAILLPNLSSEQAIADLDLMGIMVSGGAACASREMAVSHVYSAMGLTEDEAKCVIRISIGKGITGEMLDSAADAIYQVYRRRVM